MTAVHVNGKALVPCQWLILGYDGHSCPSKRSRTRMSNLH